MFYKYNDLVRLAHSPWGSPVLLHRFQMLPDHAQLKAFLMPKVIIRLWILDYVVFYLLDYPNSLLGWCNPNWWTKRELLPSRKWASLLARNYLGLFSKTRHGYIKNGLGDFINCCYGLLNAPKCYVKIYQLSISSFVVLKYKVQKKTNI